MNETSLPYTLITYFPGKCFVSGGKVALKQRQETTNAILSKAKKERIEEEKKEFSKYGNY